MTYRPTEKRTCIRCGKRISVQRDHLWLHRCIDGWSHGEAAPATPKEKP